VAPWSRASRENIGSAQERATLQGVSAADNGTTPDNASAWDAAPAHAKRTGFPILKRSPMP